MLLWSGCSAGITASDYSALPSDDGATEITIEVWDVWGFYQSAALKFKTETGIKVNVVNNFSTGPNEDLFENIERIQAELMAGKGADIYANTYLDYIEIGKNKHLCNLADWIAQDPGFSDDAYYMNILKSGFDEGNLYSVPLFMMFNALGSTIEVSELDGKSLNWKEFFELTQGIKRSGVLYGLTDYELFRRLFEDRYDRFIDEENRTQSLNSSEMVKLLEQCREWSGQGLCIPFDAENYLEMAENAFFQEYGGGIEVLTNIRANDPRGSSPYFYDIPSDSGRNDKANKISPADYICINAASPYKGTAWKFVRFLLSEEIQATGHNTPVNRKAAEEGISEYIAQIIEYYNVDIDADQAIKETEAILDAVDKVPNIFPTDIERIVFNKNARRYFSNEISAEEAAKSMAAAVDLYFKEQ
jgi:ABC-type sugar transport system, periplasmic component